MASSSARSCFLLKTFPLCIDWPVGKGKMLPFGKIRNEEIPQCECRYHQYKRGCSGFGLSFVVLWEVTQLAQGTSSQSPGEAQTADGPQNTSQAVKPHRACLLTPPEVWGREELPVVFVTQVSSRAPGHWDRLAPVHKKCLWDCALSSPHCTGPSEHFQGSPNGPFDPNNPSLGYLECAQSVKTN